MLSRLLAALAVVLTLSSPSLAQFGPKEEAATGGSRLDKGLTKKWQVGVKVRAVGGSVGPLMGTIPVPSDWPEQQVKVVAEDVTPHVGSVTYRVIEGGVKQMVFNIPQIPANDTAKALITFEVTKHSQLAPTDTTGYVIPKNPPKDTRKFLGPSPMIEIANAKIKALTKELVAGKEGAWAQVESLCDGVREKVKLDKDKIKGAQAALRDGKADQEDLTALFVACCRIHKVPARMVWIPDSCYAEFYLEDAKGKGFWFPCQIAGEKAFGAQPDQRPILQKGDNFKVPEKKESMRFVNEFLTGKGGGGSPEVEFVRRLEEK
ncbi:MAG: transglutaminase family protein [Planctomycetales bacterium]|nr:transglutaminase family protein [Planctomycetales bacterium]